MTLCTPSSVQAYGDSKLLNLFFQWLYQLEPSYFNFSEVVSWLKAEYAIAIKSPPVIQLGTVETANIKPGGKNWHRPNFLLRYKSIELAIYKHQNRERCSLISSVTFDISLDGYFIIQNNKIAVNSLTSKVTSGGFIENPLLENILQNYAFPVLEKQIRNIDLPQFQNLFSSQLNLQITDIAVIRDILSIQTTITNDKTSKNNYQENSDYQIIYLPKTSDDSSILAITANAEAINLLIDAFLPPLSKNFAEINGDDLTAIGLKASIEMGKPTISIQGNNATGTANLSTYIQGGIKLLGTWNWMAIPIPDTQLTLSLGVEKDSQGKTGFLKFTSVDKLNISLENIPNIPEPEQQALISLFKEILRSFKIFIDSELSQVKIPLFELPNTVPGTDIKANLKFHDFSLVNSRIQALIRVSSPAPR